VRLLGKLWCKSTYTPPPYQSFALYEGQVYFPTIGVTPNGVYREIDPVWVAPVTRQAIADALRHAFALKRPTVREYHRGDPAMKSPVQIAAKCRSWISFARASLRYGIGQGKQAWFVSVSAGPTRDDTETRELPLEASPDALAGVAIELADRYPLWRTAGRGERELERTQRRRTRS
jgi:hypothetical protein